MKIIILFLYWNFIILLIYTPFNFFLYYIITYIDFILKYFIPIYFMLSYYSIKNRKTDNSKIKYNIFEWYKLYLFNLIIFFKKNIYQYIYIYILVFFFILIFSFFKEKIYFFILLSFCLVFILLFFLYKISYKLKNLIKENFIFLNISFLMSSIYIYKEYEIITNTDYDYINDENSINKIIELLSPKLLFRNSFNILYPQYSDELKILNNKFFYYDNFFKDIFFFRNKNLKLDINYDMLLSNINNNCNVHKNLIESSDLYILNFFKNFYSYDNYKNLLIDNYKFKQLIYNYYLFDLNNNINKSYNLYNFKNSFNKNIFFENKNLYANCILKKLNITKNLLVNTHFKEGYFEGSVLEFDESPIFESVNYPIDIYIDKILNKDYLNDNFYLLIIKENYINNWNYFLYFINLNKNINLNIVNNDIINNDFIFSLKKFFNDIFIYIISNKFNFYYKNELLNFSNKYLRELNIESDLNILYNNLYFNYNQNDYKNSLLLLDNLFIYLFEDQYNMVDFWSDLASSKDIALKDSFNLYRNLSNNIIFLYSKNRKDINEYHEYNIDGTHYEEVSMPEELLVTDLENDDAVFLYSRYINYNTFLELFINSYLWLSLDDSNIQLEYLKYLNELNEYLNEYYENYNLFINEESKKMDIDNDIVINKLANDYISSENLNLNFFINQFLDLDFNIKNLLFNDNILFLKKFIKQNYNYNYNYIFIQENDSIFLKKYGSFNNLFEGDFFNNIEPFGDDIINKKIYDFNIFKKYKNSILLCNFYEFVYKNKIVLNLKVIENINIFNFINENNTIYIKNIDFLVLLFKEDFKTFNNIFNSIDLILKKLYMRIYYINSIVKIESNNMINDIYNIYFIEKEILNNKSVKMEEPIYKFNDLIKNINELNHTLDSINECRIDIENISNEIDNNLKIFNNVKFKNKLLINYMFFYDNECSGFNKQLDDSIIIELDKLVSILINKYNNIDILLKSLNKMCENISYNEINDNNILKRINVLHKTIYHMYLLKITPFNIFSFWNNFVKNWQYDLHKELSNINFITIKSNNIISEYGNDLVYSMNKINKVFQNEIDPILLGVDRLHEVILEKK